MAVKLVPVKEASPEEIAEKIERLDSYFSSHKTFDRTFRIEQLKKLKKSVQKYEKEIFDALHQELGKSEVETLISDVVTITSEISYVIKHLKGWMKPDKMNSGILSFGSKTRVTRAPKGRVLIMSPWNYPINLTLIPLISSISAGNVTMIKPSELVPKTSELLRKIIEETFDPGFVEVVEGGPQTATKLLESKWGHILFTGSSRVGKIVYKAAAETLSPVTLELGGKSPTIVDGTSNLNLAAKRIALGSFFNTGQTCVSPDYILVHKNFKEILIEKLSEQVKKFYEGKALDSINFSSIVNERSFDRLNSLLDGQNIIVPTQEEKDRERKFIPPTFVLEPSMDTKIMKEEIFGPILPIKTYTSEEELMSILAKNPEPLALYIFSKDKDFIDRLCMSYPSGDVVINDAIVHAGLAGSPFGGVGSSGMGTYKGRYGFETFTQIKTVLYGNTLIDNFLKYPPYPAFMKKLVRWLMG